METAPNPHEEAARAIKVAKLVAVFRATTNGTAFNVSMLDNLGWSLAEQAAGVNPSSATTRAAVVEQLQAVAAAATAMPPAAGRHCSSFTSTRP